MTEITKLAWGVIEVTIDDVVQQFRDCKAWPGGAVEWDWSLTGTHHSPGIQPDDILEVLDHGVDDMVLSRGMLLRLEMCPETISLLKERGINAHVHETRRAVAKFNRMMMEGRRVGGVFHSTC